MEIEERSGQGFDACLGQGAAHGFFVIDDEALLLTALRSPKLRRLQQGARLWRGTWGSKSPRGRNPSP
jgi:hypothetical protein